MKKPYYDSHFEEYKKMTGFLSIRERAAIGMAGHLLDYFESDDFKVKKMDIKFDDSKYLFTTSPDYSKDLIDSSNQSHINKFMMFSLAGCAAEFIYEHETYSYDYFDSQEFNFDSQEFLESALSNEVSHLIRAKDFINTHIKTFQQINRKYKEMEIDVWFYVLLDYLNEKIKAWRFKKELIATIADKIISQKYLDDGVRKILNEMYNNEFNINLKVDENSNLPNLY